MLELAFPLAAALCFGIAATIQKYAISRLPTFSLRVLARNATWLGSLALGGLGLLLYLAALRYSTLSIVQPMLGLVVLIPILAGLTFFKERLRVIEWLSIALMALGLGLVLA